MGKNKRKGGLTGVSRFLFQSMKADEGSEGSQALEKAKESTAEKADDHPAKKRKMNDGSSYAENVDDTKTRWVEKYDATGLVPHYTEASQVPQHLQKYFSQRERFFSLYSTAPGCLLDEEGWYSVTPELLADQIAERCRCDTILDAFCGVGGNAIAFAKTCQRVVALDTSPTRLALARHNAQIYGVADRIEFVLTDYISFVRSQMTLPSHSNPESDDHQERRKFDVVFLSPPWGGPSYLSGSTDDVSALDNDKDIASSQAPEHPSYSLSSIRPIHGTELFDLTRKITKNVAYYLPRNTRLEEISELLSQERKRSSGQSLKQKNNPAVQSAPPVEEKVEVEEEWMGNKLKALTCYFGGLVSGQEGMF
ncbi:Trimethylguanosine synthase [Psilocybe cubensis]|uniref:Trimethylguanosine synthase n=2 Tax=Psilocybe cubensis TaxID=181762 RepID=A0ACB8GTW7_PSICU|nr:Trimethylguanosine synthase [Psilocybe cubensis]KAH9479170.1 Trimethylguanosine synthase [Psilocybe cubensis]